MPKGIYQWHRSILRHDPDNGKLLPTTEYSMGDIQYLSLGAW